MKRIVLFGICSFLVVFSVILSGCSQPGQTPADIRREHIRTRRVNSQLLADDLERILHYDEPSKLSEFHIR
jgi:hypothetical protein